MYTFVFQQTLLHQFCSASLYGKVVLGKRDLWLAWITVLGNEIASITSQHVVFDFTLSTFSKRYHFPNAGKMIFYHFASVDTSVFSSLDDSFKSFPFGITQHLCKFSCTPTFYAFVFVGNSFELLEQFFDFFFLHNCLFL
ncbi:Uncharacterised protein [Segatella copri]|nr:Uncharacterised protein [Segatella copri]